jgi:hypothetical protein
VITELAHEHGNIPNSYDFINFTIKNGRFVSIGYNSNKYIHEFELWYGSPFEKPFNDLPVVL